MTAPRKLPALEGLTEAFWTGGADGVLNIQHCEACGRWQHPPLARCLSCHSADLMPRPVSGRGRVATYTVNHQAWAPGMDESFVFAAIELAEQKELYVLSNVICPPAQVRHGMAVQVAFEAHDDVWIPVFVPAENADG